MNFEEIPRVFLTLRCNYHCHFCPYKKDRRKELTGVEWIKLLNQYRGNEVVFTGGEPHLHRDFIQILNALGKDKVIRVYSNGSFPIEMLDKIDVYLKWYVSYHPGQLNTAAEVAGKCRAILDKGHTLINVHTNESSKTVQSDFDIFTEHGLELRIEKDMMLSAAWLNYKKSCKPECGICTYPRVYIDPSGNRYICLNYLERQDPQGIIPHFDFPAVFNCDDMSKCNPCDICTAQGVTRESTAVF